MSAENVRSDKAPSVLEASTTPDSMAGSPLPRSRSNKLTGVQLGWRVIGGKGLMDSNDKGFAGLPRDELLPSLVTSLAAKHASSSVAAIRSGDSLPGSGLPAWPDSWEHRVVNSDGMTASTQALMNEGHLVFMFPTWGRWPSEPSTFERKGPYEGNQAPTSRQPLEMHEEILLGCSPPDMDAQLYALLPASAIRSERSRFFRAALMAQWSVSDVIFLQGVLPNVDRRFECVLLGLRPHGRADGTTRFFEAGSTAIANASQVLADFARLQKMKGGRTEFGYVFRGELEAGDSLAYALRDPNLQAKREDLANFGRTAILEELFEVRSSPQRLSSRSPTSCSADSPGAARVLSGHDLVQKASVSKPTEARWIEPDPRDLLQPNDFLVPVITSGSDRRGFVVSRSPAVGPVVAGPTVLVLRPLDSVPTEIIEFAVAYLRSPVARRMYFAYNREARLVTDFGQMVVPVPDEEILTALHNLRDAQSNFQEWADEAGAVIDSIFEYPSIKEARPRIIEAGRSIRWRSREARNLDDPDFAVRRAFPYPIAHRWRVMEAALSGASSPGAGYTSILDTAETVLAFLAQVVLVLAQSSDIEVKAVEPIRRKLRKGSGPGMGDWAAILQETTAKHFSEAQGALVDIIGMFRTPEVEAARIRLSNRRNDEAHNRRVESVEIEEANRSAVGDLRTLTKAAEFLVDMPLRHVTATSWDSFVRKATVTYREMLGDHWVVKSQTTQVPSNEIESDSLYVVDPEGHWHLLRPYLVVRNCPECRTISTFHVDAVKNGKVRLKSLENGHTVTDSRDFAALTRVGLI